MAVHAQCSDLSSYVVVVASLVALEYQRARDAAIHQYL